jgi:Ulp1 family protease
MDLPAVLFSLADPFSTGTVTAATAESIAAALGPFKTAPAFSGTVTLNDLKSALGTAASNSTCPLSVGFAAHFGTNDSKVDAAAIAKLETFVTGSNNSGAQKILAKGSRRLSTSDFARLVESTSVNVPAREKRASIAKRGPRAQQATPACESQKNEKTSSEKPAESAAPAPTSQPAKQERTANQPQTNEATEKPSTKEADQPEATTSTTDAPTDEQRQSDAAAEPQQQPLAAPEQPAENPSVTSDQLAAQPSATTEQPSDSPPPA